MAGQEVSTVMENITSQLEKLNVRIESLETEIKVLEQKIDLVEKEYERQDYQGEKEHLRRKEEHLRRKEELLRKEKELLIQERIQLQSASGSRQDQLLVEMRDKQEEMLDLLHSKQVTKVHISQVDSRVRAHLLDSCGFTTILEETETSEPSVGQFRAFDWPQMNEEKDSSYACEHFQQELKNFGVKFGWGWWKLVDVRGDKSFLSVQVGNIALLGTADAVIVPFKVARDGAPYQIRVVLDWKCPDCSEWTSCRGQAFAELIAAYARSKSPLIGVLTDLQSRFHILKPCLGDDGNLCIAECLDLTPLQAMKKIVDFLASISRSNDYDLVEDHTAADTAYARASKKIKDTIPENPLARVLALADFLPPAEREQLIWDAFAGQQMWSCNSEPPPQMYV